jgi:hypothetical protein
MESLIRLLEALIQKVPWLSEAEQSKAMGWLRDVADAHGITDAVPPEPVDANTAPPPTPAPDPGPVAEPVPAAEQTPPPASPEVAATAPEDSNAFSGTDPNAPPA